MHDTIDLRRLGNIIGPLLFTDLSITSLIFTVPVEETWEISRSEVGRYKRARGVRSR